MLPNCVIFDTPSTPEQHPRRRFVELPNPPLRRPGLEGLPEPPPPEPPPPTNNPPATGTDDAEVVVVAKRVVAKAFGTVTTTGDATDTSTSGDRFGRRLPVISTTEQLNNDYGTGSNMDASTATNIKKVAAIGGTPAQQQVRP